MEAQAKRIAELADLLVESGERLKKQSERIAELERDKEALEYALDAYASAVELKDKRIDELYERITKLEQLLADAVRFIAYAHSKGVHGGEAIAKEIEENLNQEG